MQVSVRPSHSCFSKTDCNCRPCSRTTILRRTITTWRSPTILLQRTLLALPRRRRTATPSPKSKPSRRFHTYQLGPSPKTALLVRAGWKQGSGRVEQSTMLLARVPQPLVDPAQIPKATPAQIRQAKVSRLANLFYSGRERFWQKEFNQDVFATFFEMSRDIVDLVYVSIHFLYEPSAN